LSHNNTGIEILTIGGEWVNRVNVQPEWLTVTTDGLGSVNDVAKCQTLSHVATCYPSPTGEFGRTPRINRQGGRDHWPDCYTVLLAGGGSKGGFVLGASDPNGAYPIEAPVSPADLSATIYWRFGIDPGSEIYDATGRPHRLSSGSPIRALFM